MSSLKRPEGIGENGVASKLPSLEGLNAKQANSLSNDYEFTGKSISPARNQRFTHADKSKIDINWKTGRVVRTAAPKYGKDGSRINK